MNILGLISQLIDIKTLRLTWGFADFWILYWSVWSVFLKLGYLWWGALDGFFFFEMLKRKDRIARESFNALIPCREPKSNRNNNGDKYNWERWRERKRMEARVFQVVRLCELTSTGCSQWATSLLYSFCNCILDDYNMLWGVLFIHRTTNTTLLSNRCGIP